ncbi:MAG: hypothetical protein M1582_05155 [Actinobacteria bacterium]|jgi:hypothetical protein|nr:hypothetical protein [Actinomycetota bacterium]
MAGQFKGLADWMLSNGVKVGWIDTPIGPRCVTAEMTTTNPLARGRSVPQIRFVCDGYCGLKAKRASKSCRTVDQQAAAQLRGTPAPAGFNPVSGGPPISLPYHAGEGGSATRALPAPGFFGTLGG